MHHPSCLLLSASSLELNMRGSSCTHILIAMTERNIGRINRSIKTRLMHHLIYLFSPPLTTKLTASMLQHRRHSSLPGKPNIYVSHLFVPSERTNALSLVPLPLTIERPTSCHGRHSPSHSVSAITSQITSRTKDPHRHITTSCDDGKGIREREGSSRSSSSRRGHIALV